jgi:hypothetical protein
VEEVALERQSAGYLTVSGCHTPVATGERERARVYSAPAMTEKSQGRSNDHLVALMMHRFDSRKIPIEGLFRDCGEVGEELPRAHKKFPASPYERNVFARNQAKVPLDHARAVSLRDLSRDIEISIAARWYEWENSARVPYRNHVEIQQHVSSLTMTGAEPANHIQLVVGELESHRRTNSRRHLDFKNRKAVRQG